MTKADIIARIAQDTGIEKSVATTVSRGIHGECQGVDDRRERGVPARVRKFHPQTDRPEKKARNFSKNTTIVIPGSPCSCVQARKDILGCG